MKDKADVGCWAKHSNIFNDSRFSECDVTCSNSTCKFTYYIFKYHMKQPTFEAKVKLYSE